MKMKCVVGTLSLLFISVTWPVLPVRSQGLSDFANSCYARNTQLKQGTYGYGNAQDEYGYNQVVSGSATYTPISNNMAVCVEYQPNQPATIYVSDGTVFQLPPNTPVEYCLGIMRQRGSNTCQSW